MLKFLPVIVFYIIVALATAILVYNSGGDFFGVRKDNIEPKENINKQLNRGCGYYDHYDED